MCCLRCDTSRTVRHLFCGQWEMVIWPWTGYIATQIWAESSAQDILSMEQVSLQQFYSWSRLFPHLWPDQKKNTHWKIRRIICAMCAALCWCEYETADKQSLARPAHLWFDCSGLQMNWLGGTREAWLPMTIHLDWHWSVGALSEWESFASSYRLYLQWGCERAAVRVRDRSTQCMPVQAADWLSSEHC